MLLFINERYFPQQIFPDVWKKNRLSAVQGPGPAHYCSSSSADILYAIYLLVGMFIEAAQVKYLAQCLTADIELAALSHQVQFPNHNQFAPFEGWGLSEPGALYTTQTVIYSVSDIMLLHVTDWCYLRPLPPCAMIRSAAAPTARLIKSLSFLLTREMPSRWRQRARERREK